MKYTEQMQYNEKCPRCENFVVLETVWWVGLSGSLYNVSCPLCKIKGENTRYKDVAFNSFLKKVAQKAKKEREKPEKILFDVANYLYEQKRKSRWIDPDKALEDLSEYAKGLGIEL